MTIIDELDTSDKILSSVDVRRLVEERYSAKNVRVVNHELICSCLFPENHKHGDKNPSFGIDLSTGLWSCLSCHATGNVASLVMQKEGVDFHDAVRILDGYGKGTTSIEELEKGLSEYRDAETPMVSYTPLENDIRRWREVYTPYWETRGFIRETVLRFELGYDSATDRAVIPIRFNGKAVGWSKRACGVQTPKYVHSPGFERNKCLFNFDDVPYAPTDNESEVIVVESPMSVIWLHQCGVKNAVATFGAYLSSRQSMWLRRFKNICIWYDPDSAGIDGTRRALETLGASKNVTVITGAKGDPNELSKEECLTDIVENRVDGLYFRSNML